MVVVQAAIQPDGTFSDVTLRRDEPQDPVLQVLRRSGDREAQARQAAGRARRSSSRFRSSSSGPTRESNCLRARRPHEDVEICRACVDGPRARGHRRRMTRSPLAGARRARRGSRPARRATTSPRFRSRPSCGSPASAPLTVRVCAGNCQRYGALDLLDHLVERRRRPARVRDRAGRRASIAAIRRPRARSTARTASSCSPRPQRRTSTKPSTHWSLFRRARRRCRRRRTAGASRRPLAR